MNMTFSSLLAVILAAAPAGALEWQALGTRAVGMGGAGVALSQGPVASYWNPASLGVATENAYGLQIPLGVHAALTGPVVAGANDLKNLNDACSVRPVPASGCSQANINATLAELNNPTDGLRVNANAGGDFKVGKLAFFANGFLDAGAVPRIDMTNNVAPTFATPNPANSIQNNKSALVIRGARILEFGLGYGHELPWVPGVFLGGNFKLLNTQVGYASQVIIQNNNGNNDIAKTLKSSATTSSGFGVDVGALWDVSRTFENVPLHPRVGLVGRNINNPKFTQSAAAVADGVTGKYTVNPQWRMGAAISPFHWWNIAADLDLTKNPTPVDGVGSRQFGLGTEINVFNRSWINIPLRFGLSRNLADSEAGTMLSAGTGLNFLHLMIDVSGTASPKRIDTQTQGKSSKIPTELGAAVQISLLFGGSEDDRWAAKHQRDEEPLPSAAPPAPEPAKSAEPAPTPTQIDQIRKDADKAHKELDQNSVKP